LTGDTKQSAEVVLLLLLAQVDHAMDSLKKSMKWDEDVYGLEYDLVGTACAVLLGGLQALNK
jgi:hypothetical protein